MPPNGMFESFDGQKSISNNNFENNRAANNGRPTDNVRPDRGLDRSNSGLAGHFDRSFMDINIYFQ